MLEQEGHTIGAVTEVQGIAWYEVTITGQSNHAGTTPIAHRHDPLYAASRIAVHVRELCSRYGLPPGRHRRQDRRAPQPHQRGAGPGHVHRRPPQHRRRRAAPGRGRPVALLRPRRRRRAGAHRRAPPRPLRPRAPSTPHVVEWVEVTATDLGHSVRQLPSGAGHDAQMFARVCPSGMIFVPSVGGISHNPAEHTEPAHLAAGADTLLQTLLGIAGVASVGGAARRPRLGPCPRPPPRSGGPMTRLVTLGAAQLGPIQRDHTRKDVVERLLDLLRQGAEHGCDLVVFPELALTTFFPRWYITDDGRARPVVRDRHARPRDPGRCSTRPPASASASASGYAELKVDEATGERHRYNAQVLVERDGSVVGTYRKVHLPGHDENEPWRRFQHLEKRYFEPGPDGFGVWRAFGGIVGMAICNDRRWPETYRVMGLQGAELILIGYNTPVHNPPAPEHDRLGDFHNHLVMQSGAYQNGTWVVGVAKAGDEEGIPMIGGSAIIAPTGEIVGRCVTEGDELAVAIADLDLCTSYKTSVFDFAKHRQPWAYGRITDQTGAILPPE